MTGFVSIGKGANAMKPLSTLMLVLLACLLAFSATAKENYHEKQLNSDTREKFDDVAASVRDEMQTGGRYEYVTPDERRTIDQMLGEIEALFEKNGSVAGMSQDTKVQLFNAQEVVNSILTRRDRDRVICTNTAPLGSHIPVTTCHTYGQEVEAREGSQNQMDEWRRGPCRGNCGDNR
jgi:hypothetical protein